MGTETLSKNRWLNQGTIPEKAIRCAYDIHERHRKSYKYYAMLRDYKNDVKYYSHWKRKIKNPINKRTGQPFKSTTLKAYESHFKSAAIAVMAQKLTIQVSVYNGMGVRRNFDNLKRRLKRYFLTQAIETMDYQFNMQYYLNFAVRGQVITSGDRKWSMVNPLTDVSVKYSESKLLEQQLEMAQSELKEIKTKLKQLKASKKATQVPTNVKPQKSVIGQSAMNRKLKRLGLSVVMGGVNPADGPFAPNNPS